MNNQTTQRTRQFKLVLSFRAHELDDKEEVISDIPLQQSFSQSTAYDKTRRWKDNG